MSGRRVQFDSHVSSSRPLSEIQRRALDQFDSAGTEPCYFCGRFHAGPCKTSEESLGSSFRGISMDDSLRFRDVSGDILEVPSTYVGRVFDTKPACSFSPGSQGSSYSPRYSSVPNSQSNSYNSREWYSQPSAASSRPHTPQHYEQPNKSSIPVSSEYRWSATDYRRSSYTPLSSSYPTSYTRPSYFSHYGSPSVSPPYQTHTQPSSAGYYPQPSYASNPDRRPSGSYGQTSTWSAPIDIPARKYSASYSQPYYAGTYAPTPISSSHSSPLSGYPEVRSESTFTERLRTYGNIPTYRPPSRPSSVRSWTSTPSTHIPRTNTPSTHIPTVGPSNYSSSTWTYSYPHHTYGIRRW